ncbi:uncharacterized protein LOC116289075, partial [Actinia tenebrosa]|uniref:Uncharacterized protein LOC116289075 n=1 Tax=Actinia tenebrosa TaxID=6105 RepID=A0A6P8H9I0_ACTTE
HRGVPAPDDTLEWILRCEERPGLEAHYINDQIGRGVFATDNFEKDTFLLEYWGESIEVCKLQREKKEVINQMHICIIAKRNIIKGEELRYDYGIQDLPWRKKKGNHKMQNIKAPKSPLKSKEMNLHNSRLQMNLHNSSMEMKLHNSSLKMNLQNSSLEKISFRTLKNQTYSKHRQVFEKSQRNLILLTKFLARTRTVANGYWILALLVESYFLAYFTSYGKRN